MVQRFSKASTNADPVDYAFSILDNVAQGDFTKWRIVYDITSREIYFLTAGKRKQVSLNDFDFTCGKPAVYLDINNNKNGRVSSAFAPLSFEENKRILQQSATESKSHVTVSDESVNRGADYFRQVTCAQ
jgi:choloylglycine hydrolase